NRLGRLFAISVRSESAQSPDGLDPHFRLQFRRQNGSPFGEGLIPVAQRFAPATGLGRCFVRPLGPLLPQVVPVAIPSCQGHGGLGRLISKRLELFFDGFLCLLQSQATQRDSAIGWAEVDLRARLDQKVSIERLLRVCSRYRYLQQV